MIEFPNSPAADESFTDGRGVVWTWPEDPTSGDQNFSAVELLLLGNGADGSTAITDSGPDARTVTVNGDTQIDTAQSKFGGSSILFDGTGDHLTVPDDDAFNLDGEFTIEFWIRYNSVGAVMMPISKWGANGVKSWTVYQFDATQFVFQWSTDGSTDAGSIIYPFSPSAGTWYHVAITRDANDNLRCFVDGTQVGATTVVADTFFNGGDPLIIGAVDTTGASAFNGWLDDVRVSSICRYAANFTPPAAEPGLATVGKGFWIPSYPVTGYVPPVPRGDPFIENVVYLSEHTDLGGNPGQNGEYTLSFTPAGSLQTYVDSPGALNLPTPWGSYGRVFPNPGANNKINVNGTLGNPGFAVDTFAEGRGSMTTEFWFNKQAGTTGCLFSIYDSNQASRYFVCYPSAIHWYPSAGSSVGMRAYDFPALADNTWHHVVWQKIDGNGSNGFDGTNAAGFWTGNLGTDWWSVWVNGVLVHNDIDALDMDPAANALMVLGATENNLAPGGGHILGPLRITKGVSRYYDAARDAQSIPVPTSMWPDF